MSDLEIVSIRVRLGEQEVDLTMEQLETLTKAKDKLVPKEQLIPEDLYEQSKQPRVDPNGRHNRPVWYAGDSPVTYSDKARLRAESGMLGQAAGLFGGLFR